MPKHQGPKAAPQPKTASHEDGASSASNALPDRRYGSDFLDGYDLSFDHTDERKETGIGGTTRDEGVSTAPDEVSEAEPATSTSARDVIAAQPGLSRDSRLFREIHAICHTCGERVAREWGGFAGIVMSETGFGRERIDVLEGVVARMVANERLSRAERADHTLAFRRALGALIRDEVFEAISAGSGLYDGDRASSQFSVELLFACESSGVRFDSRDDFVRFRDGLALRVFGRAAIPSERLPPRLAEQLAAHVPHVPPHVRARIANPDVLLTAVDLFAEAGGIVPLCTAMRLSWACTRRRIGQSDAFWIWRAFGADRTDDLVALLEHAQVRTRDLENLASQPERLSGMAFDDLTRRLVA